MSAGTTVYQWQAERYEASTGGSLAASRLPALAFGVVLLGGLPAAAWFALAPSTTVEMRFVADIAGPTGRAALAEAAMRLAAASMASTRLTGESLVVSIANRDAKRARDLARSASVAVLDMAIPIANEPVEPPPPVPQAVVVPTPPPNPALAERARLSSVLDAADSRLAALSTALTGVTRDLAAAVRVTPDRKSGRETLDKATVALADLQLQRIQLQSRYQDDFPAVVALDGQIRSVRALIADEARKVEAANRAVPDPGDPILTAERDRLRAEQSQVLERRTTTEAQLAEANRAIASEAKVEPPQPPPPTPPQPVRATLPAPLLMEAATTISRGPDFRWWAMSAAAFSGLLALLAVWFVPRRRSRAMRAEMVLQRLEAMLLAQNPAAPGQQIEKLLLSRTTAALLLQPSREKADTQRWNGDD